MIRPYREAAGARKTGRGAKATPDLSPDTAAPLAVDLDMLAEFFGIGPAWSDDFAGRHRFRVDAPAGGWLELYIAPAERLVSLRVADGAVHAIHVDLTLEAVEEVSVRCGGDGTPWLDISAGRSSETAPCTASVTLGPDIMVVLNYGRR